MSKVFSYGGGVQSTAALVLASQGKIDFNVFVFANVGEDSENPATLKYVEEIAIPFAREHNLVFATVQKKRKDGTPVTIYGNILSDNKSIGIPVYMSNGAPGKRACTVDFKIKPIARWMKQNGYSYPIGLGISIDEIHRARFHDPEKSYPLLDLGLHRRDCVAIIEKAGLPIPPKSSCYFCPFHCMTTWQKMRNEEPELFEKSEELEKIINERRKQLGKDNVWLSRKLIPLRKATSQLVQESLFDDIDMCESGYCGL